MGSRTHVPTEYLYGHFLLQERVNSRPRWELENLGIKLTWTPCHLGGSRPWFVCPDCGRRCGVLYYTNFLRDHLACRRCLRLIYASTREKPFDRLIRRVKILPLTRLTFRHERL